VHTGQQAERIPFIHPITLVAAQRRASGAADPDVVAHPPEQHRIERRTHPPRDLDMTVELGDQGVRHGVRLLLPRIAATNDESFIEVSGGAGLVPERRYLDRLEALEAVRLRDRTPGGLLGAD
jgi:hypothetical protein